MVYDYLTQLPLVSFVIWASIVVTQVSRGRTRTLTEISFIVGSLAWSGYALTDWLFFRAGDTASAALLLKVSISFVTTAAFFLFFFSKLFLTRPHRTDAPLAIPFILVLFAAWGGLVTGVQSVPWGWKGVWNDTLFGAWLLTVVAYASVGIWYMYKTYLVVRNDSSFLGNRVLGVLVSFVLGLALALGTNAAFEIRGVAFMPLFSTVIAFPGVITLYVLVPLGKERISSAIRRWKSQRYQILGVYIIYENGTLIASRTATTDQQVDDDIFGATLDAIQTFMRTSFPLLIGKWLRRIEHGDVKILIERGRHSYLAVVLRGDDPDTLWIKMKESVERFETRNASLLADWSGVTNELSVVEQTLEDMFTERSVFA